MKMAMLRYILVYNIITHLTYNNYSILISSWVLEEIFLATTSTFNIVAWTYGKR